MYRTGLTVQDWGFGVESQWACVAFFKLCLERLGRLELVFASQEALLQPPEPGSADCRGLPD